MRTLQQGQCSVNVKCWQEFLATQGFSPGAIDGEFGPNTREATIRYQSANGLKPDGVVGPLTLARSQQQGFKPPKERFEIGPDKAGDVRELRPYFLLPLDEDQADFRTMVIKRIKSWVEQSVSAKGPVTDLYILSHGWHRNFLSAVAAYDRLSSRLAVLLHRGRLQPPEKYHPIFLTVHWHSDPGENFWVDKDGRRHKADFMEKVRTLFEPRDEPAAADFANDFEDLFELFSRMAAPSTEALSGVIDADRLHALTASLDKYNLRDAYHAERYDKAAAVWTCYFESKPKRVLVDQQEKPEAFMGFSRAFITLVRFLIGVLGIVVFLGLLYRALVPIGGGVWELLVEGWMALNEAAPFVAALVQDWRFWLVGLFIAAVLYLIGVASLCTRHPEKAGRGVPVLTVLAWVYLQVLFILPLLGYLFVTYFTGGLFRRGLFDERFGIRNKSTTETPGLYPRYLLAEFARYPLLLFKDAVPPDSALVKWADSLNQQLAFWEMQRKAVDTGHRAAEVIAELVRGCPGLAQARIHFIGHSFGALVVANTVRRLALDTNLRPHIPDGAIHTLCLVQGALGSGWFEKETALRQSVNGAIAAIYSRYDSANGFYYPLGNHGRLAAGYVGLLGKDFTTEKQGGWPMLVHPPTLAPPSPAGRPRILNIDASRLIYEGPVALGGGHGDIFKDDVLHLIWAVTVIGVPVKPGRPIASQEAAASEQAVVTTKQARPAKPALFRRPFRR
jgi:hypothetical protein